MNDGLADAAFATEMIDHFGDAGDAVPDNWIDYNNMSDHSAGGIDTSGVSMAANMLQDEELSDPSLRLLETDTQIVVPVNKVVKLLITSNDVLHAWTIPAFAVKKDAVPGRLNETWFKAEKTGTYYGQCSELCGPKHAFMPINVKVVSQDEFDNWLNFAKEEYASSKTNFNQTFQVAKN